MEFNQDMKPVQSCKFPAASFLKQELEILEMNSQELFEYVEEQLETNPVLELADNDNYQEENNPEFEELQKDWDDNTENSDEFREPEAVKLSLKEHLQNQLYFLGLDERQTRIGEFIIDNIDENGYISADLSEIAAFFKTTAEKVKNILLRIQTFDPPGICARNLKECLSIQLRQMREVDSNAIVLVENYLDALASGNFSEVAKNTGLSDETVMEILGFIKTLEPKPGREYYNNGDLGYVLPDVIIKKIKNRFEILVNEDAVPRVNVNSYYKRITFEDISQETKMFIQSKLDSARGLIKCLEKRTLLIRKVAECISDRQVDFFEKGKKFMQPLTLKQVAKDAGLKESVVSRTVRGKYIQCAWGYFEMNYFFAKRNIGGYGLLDASEAVKLKIKNMIADENKISPFSDSEICSLLRKEGIKISRRTVTKYRNELGLKTSMRRKKR